MSNQARLFDSRGAESHAGQPFAAHFEGDREKYHFIVRLRSFVGLTVPEIATALDLAPRTVDRHWAFARAWLKRTIRDSLSEPVGST